MSMRKIADVLFSFVGYNYRKGNEFVLILLEFKIFKF